MNKIIAIVGMTGSGKSKVSDYLVSKGFHFIRFGQLTLDTIKERGLKPTEENESKIREGIRKEHGMGGFAILNIPKIEKFLEQGNVVVDGLYSWSEYKILKEKYGDRLTVVAVYAPPKLRYERLAGRFLEKGDIDLRHRPMTLEQARSRDFAQVENIEQGGPIAMADYTIINTSTVEHVRQEVDKILDKVLK